MGETNNIILIVLDTLREDYATPISNVLSRYGFIRYTNTISSAPWTVPAHASIFTGLYPCFHKAHETRNKKGFEIRIKYGTVISSILRNMGYTTYLITANPYIRPSLGFGAFDKFYEVGGWEPNLSLLTHEDMVLLSNLKIKTKDNLGLIRILAHRYPSLLIRGGISKLLLPLNIMYKKINAKLKNWPLDKGINDTLRLVKKHITPSSAPLFLFVNLMEMHEPYFIGDDGTPVRKNLMTGEIYRGYLDLWIRGYSKASRYLAGKLELLMKILKQKNMFETSLIIVTSDHGQLLGEHGRIGHGTFLYDELLKVPLFIKYPKDSDIRLTKNVEEYISLTSLKSFILNFIENKITNDDILYSKTVFAESYGIGGVTVNPKTKEEKKNIEQLEKYRITIYNKNFKGVFNVTDWKFEEIISYSHNTKITEDIVKQMKKEVIKFLKMATVARATKI